LGVGRREDEPFAGRLTNDEKLDLDAKLNRLEFNFASGDSRADDGVAILVFRGMRLGLG